MRPGLTSFFKLIACVLIYLRFSTQGLAGAFEDARGGNVWAQFVLTRMYYSGEAVEQGEGKDTYWLQKFEEPVDGDQNRFYVATIDIWQEFEALKTLNGQSYMDARDRLLAQPDIDQRLHPYLSSGDWQDYFQAKILYGWLHDGDFYREFLREINSDEFEAEVRRWRPTILGADVVYNRYGHAARYEYKETINPLCLEYLLKMDEEGGYPGLFSKMLYAAPDPDDIDMAMSLLISTDDERIKSVMFGYLARMPRPDLAPQLEVLETFIENLKTRIAIAGDAQELVIQRRELMLMLREPQLR